MCSLDVLTVFFRSLLAPVTGKGQIRCGTILKVNKVGCNDGNAGRIFVLLCCFAVGKKGGEKGREVVPVQCDGKEGDRSTWALSMRIADKESSISIRGGIFQNLRLRNLGDGQRKVRLHTEAYLSQDCCLPTSWNLPSADWPSLAANRSRGGSLRAQKRPRQGYTCMP